MTFTDDQLVRALGSIVCMTLRPQNGVTEVVKGRVDDYDHQSVSLLGDSGVLDPLQGPDPQQGGSQAGSQAGSEIKVAGSETKVVRLGPQEARTIRFIEVKDARWSR
jgi:hypothetical protein